MSSYYFMNAPSGEALKQKLLTLNSIGIRCPESIRSKAIEKRSFFPPSSPPLLLCGFLSCLREVVSLVPEQLPPSGRLLQEGEDVGVADVQQHLLVKLLQVVEVVVLRDGQRGETGFTTRSRLYDLTLEDMRVYIAPNQTRNRPSSFNSCGSIAVRCRLTSPSIFWGIRNGNRSCNMYSALISEFHDFASD